MQVKNIITTTLQNLTLGVKKKKENATLQDY